MDCARCGRSSPADAAFCLTCGAPLTDGATAASLAAAVAAPPIEAAPSAPSAVAFPEPTARPYAPTLGPVDRVSFFREQRRRRRQTWRLTALCGLAAIVAGIPLSLLLTPVIFAVVIVLTRLLGLVVAVPMGVWGAYRSVTVVVVNLFRYFDDESRATTHIAWTDVALAAVVWLLPGILLMLLIWPAIRRLFRTAGVGGVLLTLGAREPRSGDLEETQLVNVVEEMAIAAGLPAPRVMLIDAEVANAATVGSGPHDAVVVVTRGLLDNLDRDETQGVLAHLIGSIGNGDLSVALSIIAVFQTFGFASALLRAPISGEARATLWRLLRFALSRRRSDAEAVSHLLTGGLWNPDEHDDLERAGNPDHVVRQRRVFRLELLYLVGLGTLGLVIYAWLKGASDATVHLIVGGGIAAAALIVLYQWRYILWGAGRVIVIGFALARLPYYLAAMMPQLVLGLLSSFLLEPLIARLWRVRVYLADATATQLTRNPQGLWNALRALAVRGGPIRGGKWAAPLFFVGADAGNARRMAHLDAQEMAGQISEAMKLSTDRSLTPDARQARMLALAQAASARRSDAEELSGGSFSGESDSGARFHPSLASREQRLLALGAAPLKAPPARRRVSGFPRARRRLSGVVMAPVIVALLAIVTVLVIVALVLLTALSLLFTGLMMVAVYGLYLALVPH